MPRIYCDNCGKDDQSQTISAILEQQNDATFSDSYGYINNPGQMPTLYKSTTMKPADPNLRRLQASAKQFASGVGVLPNSKLAPDVEAKRKERNAIRWTFIIFALPIGGILALGLFGAALWNKPNAGPLMLSAIGAFTLLIGFWSQKSYSRFLVKNEAKIDSWWASLTQEEKNILHRAQAGSYCRRCARFSPAHD